jgi:hypothetical protein
MGDTPGDVSSPTPTQAASEWTKVSSDDSVIQYVDQTNIVKIGSTATIWFLQDFRVFLGPDGKEMLRGAPGKEFRSVKFHVEYDCKADLYRGLYYGTFPEHMGHGVLADGGPIKNGDPLAAWQAVPPDMAREREIACASTEPTIPLTAPLAVPDTGIERSWLGVRVQEVTPEIAESVGLPKAEGALVASLTPGGAAEKAGIKPGDVIETYNEHPVVTMHDLPLVVADTPIGQTVNVTLWRGGQQLTLAPTIMAMPNNPEPLLGDTPAAQSPIQALPPDQNAAADLYHENETAHAPPDATAQWTDAWHRYCYARHTRLACVQYVNDTRECLREALQASVILMEERWMMRQGETPQTAARFAAEQSGNGEIAALALRVPAKMTPREFTNWVMKDCLEGIAQ